MNEKDRAVAKLKEKGFDAYNSSSVVMVRINFDEGKTDIIKEIRKVLDDIGYKASFGITGKASLEQIQKALPEDPEEMPETITEMKQTEQLTLFDLTDV